MAWVLSDKYKAYRHALDLASALMIRGNTAAQMIYVNVAPEWEWSDEMMRIWSGSDEDRVQPRVSISDPRRLRCSDVLEPDVDTEGQKLAVRGELWPPRPGRTREDELQLLARRAYVILRPQTRLFAGSRFAIWARLFQACCDILDDLPGQRPWFIRTWFHGGWETYYAAFQQLGACEEEFALSEQGHLASSKHAADMDRLGSFNLREQALARASRRALRNHLRRAAETFL